MMFDTITNPFDGDSFGANIPVNYEEICDFLNDYFEENGYTTKEEANDIWEDYCNGKIPDAPIAIFEDEKKTYTVFYIGGERDGETLFTTDNENEAIKYARKFYDEHENEFDSVCGGVGIVDEKGKDVIDW